MAAVAAGLAAVVALARVGRPPSETTPEGAYARIAMVLSAGDERGVLAYLDDASVRACDTIWRDHQAASDLVDRTFPEPERSRLVAAYRAHALATSVSDVWLELARRNAFLRTLRQDLSGVATVEAAGDGAVVVTARGARYPFRRRSDGTWGLTIFSNALAREADKAEMDLREIRASASDYERVGPAGVGNGRDVPAGRDTRPDARATPSEP